MERFAKNLAALIIKRGDFIRRPVPVFLPKSIGNIVANVGILYSGNAYANLDIKSPVQRVCRRNWGTMSPDFLAGNRLSLLNSGRAYFPALLRAIREAEREVFLESYIYANDAIGQEVAHALARAAARGVAVRVLVDGFGARNFEKDFVPRLQEAGVECLVYRREIAPFKMRRHRLRRLHRKIAVIDVRVAFVGGINIVDDYNAPSRMAPRYDYAVQVEGPVLSQIHRAVRLMWERVAWASFRRRRSLPPAEDWPCCEVSGQQSARFLQRDNLRHRNDIAHAYLDAIDL